MGPDLVRGSGYLETRGSERLANGIVKLTCNLGTFPFLGVHDFRAQLAHSIPAGRKAIEHFVDCRRQPGELAVGHE